MQTIANIDACRANLHTKLAINTIPQALRFGIRVFFARAARVTSLGVDFAQGFAIGKPAPLADLLAELPLYASMTPLIVDSLADTARNPLIAVGQ